ncbi:MAG: hypothetical protein Q4F00_13095, partial [bacterium]|nr:hypothetical protein [bacterium]
GAMMGMGAMADMSGIGSLDGGLAGGAAGAGAGASAGTDAAGQASYSVDNGNVTVNLNNID